MTRWDDYISRDRDCYEDDRYEEDIELLEAENLLQEEEERKRKMQQLLWGDEQYLLMQATLKEDLYD